MSHHSSSKDPDYYWRPFFGRIPNDAVHVHDKSSDCAKVYIGRGPAEGKGLLIGELTPNDATLNVTIPGVFPPLLFSPVREVTEYVEILCSGHPEKLVWRPATYQTIDKIRGVIKAGFEGNNDGVLYVGRAFHDNGIKIGKVPGYDRLIPSNIRLYIADSNKGEIKVDSYEVLTYETD